MNTRIQSPTQAALSRRNVLLGAAGAAFLAACGSGGNGTDDAGGTTTSQGPGPAATEPTGTGPALVALFPFQGGYAATGRAQRLTWGVFESPGLPMLNQPDDIEFTLSLQDSEGSLTPVETITAPRREVDIPRPYYATRFTPEVAGLYLAEIEVDGTTLTSNFFVNAPDDVELVQIGDPMIAVRTPTVDDPIDVDPICTRNPPCAFHELSLSDPVTEGRPVAFLVSTPAFCEVSICGPVLDILIEAQPEYEGVDFVHAEVFTNPLDVESLQSATLAGSVAAYGMTFEPALFVADANGILIDRLDSIYDADEARESLDKIAV